MPVAGKLGQYEIISFLGKGGMGEVYRASDRASGRDVALKTLPPEMADDRDRLRRFMHEAKAASSIVHPNVAGIYEIGQSAGVHFIAMEYVEGETLRRRIERGAIAEDELLRIAEQIVEGLDAAHCQHLVHRDLKPSNIMITPTGRVKLLDFGLAKTLLADNHGETISRHTEVGAILGTVSYMSPEQALGSYTDHRSDIFSLGVVLYELATRRLPFCGLNPIQTINRIMNTEPEPVSRVNAKISPGLGRIIMRCLEKDAERRFQSAAELLQDLRRPEPDTEIRSRIVPAVNNLPQQLTRFIGRQEQVAEIRKLVAEHRLVTLAGSGGIGKTRLALQVASESLDTYRDGVWFVELASLADGSLVAQTAAAAIGVQEQRGQAITETLVEHLKSRNALLVLDNCEHLPEASAALAETLLQACAKLRILVTSRGVLAIPGEAVFRVPTLGLPDRDLPADTAGLARQEAVALFADRARLVAPDFEVNDENAPAIANICVQLDGIPLAIELAASQVRMFSIEQIRARLEDHFALVLGRSRTRQPRQQTLLATMDWSYKLLGENEQALFRRLSVFSGGWTLDAAATICSGEAVEEREVSQLLSRLVNKSLVIPENRDAQQRYRFLTTLAKYAARQLKNTEGAASLKRRHTDFFVRLAEGVLPKLRGADQGMWLERLNSDYDNMRAVLTFSLANNHEIALRLAAALGRFWYFRGHFQEGRKWLSDVLDIPQPAGMELQRAKVLQEAAAIAQGQSDNVAACRFSEDALDLFRRLDNKPGIASTLNTLGVLAKRRGDNVGAQGLFEQSIEMTRDLGDNDLTFSGLNNLGILAFRSSDYGMACRHYQESLRIARKLGDKRLIAMTLYNLGNVVSSQGDLKQARALQEESLALVRELRARNLVAAALVGLCDIVLLQGDYDTASSLVSESLAISLEIGDKRGVAWGYTNMAVIAVQQGAVAEARRHVDQGLAILRNIDDKAGLVGTLLVAGEAACFEGDYSAARSLLEECRAASEASDNSQGVALTLCQLGDLARRECAFDDARSLLSRSLSMFRELGCVRYIATPLEWLAAVCVNVGEYERAVRLWGAAHALRAQMSLPRPPAEHESYKRSISAVKTALGETAFEVFWASGETMSLDDALEYAKQ